MFCKYNRKESSKIINYCFDLDSEDCEHLDEIISWLESNTTSLVYISREQTELLMFGHPATKIFMAGADDAMNFKLRWMN